MRRLAVSAMLLALSCAHGGNANYGQAAEAILMVATAASVSALSVASGGCAAQCEYGTYCDEHGLCKAYPCHDSCRSNEECVSQPIEHCVPIHAGMEIHRPPESAPLEPVPAHELPSDAPRK